MKSTISLELILVLVLTLVGNVATGEIIFLDDFEDGSATDGDPVIWSPLPGGRGSFEVIPAEVREQHGRADGSTREQRPSALTSLSRANTCL